MQIAQPHHLPQQPGPNARPIGSLPVWGFKEVDGRREIRGGEGGRREQSGR